jgi:hypothetical protein
MRVDQRVARLKELAAELERLPPSSARESLLRDVRARAVVLETGDEDHLHWLS